MSLTFHKKNHLEVF